MEIGNISARQFMIVVMLFVVGDAVLYVPSWITEEAKQDAWIAAILSIGQGLLMATLFVALGKRYPSFAITQISERILGAWLGKAVALLFISFFLTDAAIMLMELGDFVTTQIMVETPIEVIMLLFAAIVVLGVRSGIESLARTFELAMPWFMLLFVILILFSSPQMNAMNLQPVLGTGMKRILSGNIKYLGNLLETVALLMVFPHVNRVRQAAKTFKLGMLAGTVIIAIFTAVSLMVLNGEQLVIYAYPSYTLAQKISVGNFFERIEAIMAIMWFITLYVKVAVLYYAVTKGLSHVFELESHRSLALPFSMIVLVVALVFVPNRPYFDKFVSLYWTPYMLTYGLFFPVLLLVVDMIRKRSGRVEDRCPEKKK